MGHECSEPCLIYTCTTRVEGFVFLNFPAGVKYSLGVNIDMCINMTTRLYDFILISFCKYFRLGWDLQMKNKLMLISTCANEQCSQVWFAETESTSSGICICICNHFEKKNNGNLLQ